MAKVLVKRDRSTDRRELVFALDSASTTGAGKDGVTMTGYYVRNTTGTTPTAVVFTPGATEPSATNMKGVYWVTVPFGAFASTNGADTCVVYLSGSGMAPIVLEYQLVAFDPDDAAGLGLTRIDQTIGSRSTLTATDVWAATTRTLTSFGTLATDVWAATTRTLTAGTNIVLAKGTGVTGFNDLNAASVTSAVWETQTSLYDAGTYNGTFGKNILRDAADSKVGDVTTHTSGGVSRIDADMHAIANDATAATTFKGMLTGVTPAAVLTASISGSVGSVTDTGAIADKVLGRNIAGGTDGGRTVKDALRILRNKFTTSTGQLIVYQENDTTEAWRADLSTDGTALPITGSDPTT